MYICFSVFKVDGKIVYPCGAIANSMFSDEITLWHNPLTDQKREVTLIRKGIAWDSDKKFKFQNPPDIGPTSPMWKKFTKPKGER